MPLAALATVLLQLIYQQLPCTDIFKLARCCRALLGAADSRVAFKYVRPLPVHSNQLDGLAPLGQRRPLRKCPLKLVCQGRLDFALLDRLASVLLHSNLHVVDLRALSVPKHLWAPLLSHEMMLNVRRLVCDQPDCNQVTEAALRRIGALPRLSSLACNPPVPMLPRWFALLQGCPSLTSLKTRGSGLLDGGVSVMLPIQRLPHLTKLHLHQPSFHWAGGLTAHTLRALLTVPPLCTQLRSLTLQTFVADPARYSTEDSPAPVEEYRAAFSALTSLTSLELSNVSSINHMLLASHVAPALTRLTMTADVKQLPMLWSDALVPSEAALERLLSAAPTLLCDVRVTVSHAPNPLQWQDCLRMCPILDGQRRFEGRVTVQSTVPTPR